MIFLQLTPKSPDSLDVKPAASLAGREAQCKSDGALQLPVQAGLAASATHSGSLAELSDPSAAAAWPCLAMPSSCTPWPSFSFYRYRLCLQMLGHVCILQADIKDSEQRYAPLPIQISKSACNSRSACNSWGEDAVAFSHCTAEA